MSIMPPDPDSNKTPPRECGAILADQHREIRCDRLSGHYTKPHRSQEWWHDTSLGKRVAVTTTWGPFWEDDPEVEVGD